ncbi:MAG: hypothetical protein ABJN57_05775 [Hyphomicrobiales bacterium]
MTDFELSLPDDFDKYAWELKSKGWYDHAVMSCKGNKYKLSFYDPVRLAQEIQNELSSVDAFLEDNLVVINTVDRSYMEKAVKYLALSGRYKSLQKMT